MKLWIRYEDTPWGGIELVYGSFEETKDNAVKTATVINSKLHVFAPGRRAVSVQEIEIDNDLLMQRLLMSYQLHDWQERVHSMIRRKDPAVKFGELVEIK